MAEHLQKRKSVRKCLAVYGVSKIRVKWQENCCKFGIMTATSRVFSAKLI